ncbi:hypothetical protein Fmac_032311 [Flemingia macrophylla]|uniref:Uncharacterized protein n=1 Tax=Flemingia macrophylla TaxID=520843 RepID=A0ABD1L4I1_9FABA
MYLGLGFRVSITMRDEIINESVNFFATNLAVAVGISLEETSFGSPSREDGTQVLESSLEFIPCVTTVLVNIGFFQFLD